MRVLGIETSTSSGSVALIEDEKVIGQFFLNIGPAHSEKLLTMVDLLFKEVGIDKNEIEGIAVSIGPGSFTALRVGISTAKGLAFTLGIPVVGVSSLEVLSHNLLFTPFMICPMIDARKKEVYAALFRYSDSKLDRMSDDSINSHEKICERIAEKTIFIGNGALLYRDLLIDSIGDLALFCPFDFNFPKASNCALIVSSKLKNGRKDDLAALAPQYLRKSEAEIYREG
ncbi:MAG: tRNA (adenosine(37)-N6)-threonylcarbamoyltransferase complex dimerization subunit type 1 TsaB [Candidatus Dadabacteria bacterium]|nr:tRNA (adenosine(37)-N6)-threonylcarbamoyltransferase complex dimerization subunit type 1 TsaB [Candidatus Dadabacteria bacterium]